MKKQTDMGIRIPVPTEEIINKPNEHGYEAYVAGGCVRDVLLGREPGDWDVTTSALPGQVKEVLQCTADTGIQHGTVTAMIGEKRYEITTYRIDGEYSGGRHPNSVEFTPDLVENLKHRDFTIDAMAYNSHTGLVDRSGGVGDLRRGITRCMGELIDRFTEDTLGILRAIRFSAQLGFPIKERTYEAIGTIASSMVHISKGWIQVELTKLLLSSHPDYALRVYETRVSPYVSEKFHKAYAGESGNWAVPPIPAGIPVVKYMRWTAFLRDCSASRVADMLRNLKLDNGTTHRVRILVERQGKKVRLQDSMENGIGDVVKDSREPSRTSIRRAMSQMEPELSDNLLTPKMCLSETASNDGELRWLRQIRGLTEEIHRDRDYISPKTLAVSGYDIMGARARPDREVGSTLARLLDMVLGEPQRNTKEYLLAHLGRRRGQAGIWHV